MPEGKLLSIINKISMKSNAKVLRNSTWYFTELRFHDR